MKNQKLSKKEIEAIHNKPLDDVTFDEEDYLELSDIFIDRLRSVDKAYKDGTLWWKCKVIA